MTDAPHDVESACVDKHILAKNISAAVLDSMSRSARFSTIAFVGTKNVNDRRVPHLLGSGVLVAACNKRAILTAGHVLDVLPRTGRLGLFMTPGSELETIDTGGLARVEFPRGPQESAGPDLGAVILAPTIASLLAAKKTFVNLDKHRETVLNATRGVHDGIWLAQGFLAEETELVHEPGGIHCYLYNFSAIGGPDEVTRVGEHDYVDYPVSFEAQENGPVSWGGMSGGGLWQVPLSVKGDEVTDERPLLAGILFYQHPTSDTNAGVRGHAWRSIYGVAYDAIAGQSR